MQSHQQRTNHSLVFFFFPSAAPPIIRLSGEPQLGEPSPSRAPAGWVLPISLFLSLSITILACLQDRPELEDGAGQDSHPPDRQLHKPAGHVLQTAERDLQEGKGARHPLRRGGRTCHLLQHRPPLRIRQHQVMTDSMEFLRSVSFACISACTYLISSRRMCGFCYVSFFLENLIICAYLT